MGTASPKVEKTQIGFRLTVVLRADAEALANKRGHEGLTAYLIWLLERERELEKLGLDLVVLCRREFERRARGGK